ncbi:hypothetical protein SAMN06265222_106265 [Neorhodopirellula lusitana]|uniref:Uncharacterized protein n=1 Tax=Neorhodopirellula lusitana TaxID=445327 RepID=A0ABY1Q4T8_9BACT|nr:hypothetical protein [Neorhodopirellula lusitana]SMP59700.1 hypothetical protein SAMN06265222_106265 [Neorhodopirellula lusitana]
MLVARMVGLGVLVLASYSLGNAQSCNDPAACQWQTTGSACLPSPDCNLYAAPPAQNCYGSSPASSCFGGALGQNGYGSSLIQNGYGAQLGRAGGGSMLFQNNCAGPMGEGQTGMSGWDGYSAPYQTSGMAPSCGASQDGYSTWTNSTVGAYPGQVACGPSNAVGQGSDAYFGRGLLGQRLAASGLYGGIEFLWMRASFDQNVALIIDPPVGNTLVPFDYSMDLTPRAWLGVQNCNGLGFRTTYFRFDDSAATESVTAVVGATPVYLYVYGAGGNLSRNANANVGQTLVSDHSLNLQAVDLEATQVFQFRQMRALLGLGIRIADMDQHLRGEVYNADGSLEEAVSNRLKFTGAGPTVSAQVTRCLGASPFSLYASGRASLLMADTEQRIYEMKGAYTTELEDIADQREVLGNFEMSLGLQYGQSIGRSAGLFVRAGYETQLWLDAGGPVNSHSSIGLDGVSFATGVNF